VDQHGACGTSRPQRALSLLIRRLNRFRIAIG
jgi:hypothetical protein